MSTFTIPQSSTAKTGHKLARSSIAAIAASLVLLLLSACETTPQKVLVEVPNCEVKNLTRIGKYAVEAWGVPDETFAVGEVLRMQIRTSAPAYLSMFHVSSSCDVTRLIDNVRVPNATIIDFPNQASGMQITVKPPSGKEGFYVIATLEKLSFLASGDTLTESGQIAKLDMNPQQFYQRIEQVRARMDPSAWGLTTLRTTVVEH